jgi:hypothetical protein
VAPHHIHKRSCPSEHTEPEEQSLQTCSKNPAVERCQRRPESTFSGTAYSRRLNRRRSDPLGNQSSSSTKPKSATRKTNAYIIQRGQLALVVSKVRPADNVGDGAVPQITSIFLRFVNQGRAHPMKPASRHIVERAARPLRRCKKEGNGRLGRVGIRGRSERALTLRG